MNKLLCIVVLFATSFCIAQTDYSNVMNLLLENKREEARALFDKEFGKIKKTNIDLLFLDAMIDQEMGKIDFDETFNKALENLPNSENFVSPFINTNLVLSDVKEGVFNDLAYKKIDFLANSPKFKNLPIVIYRRAVFERMRYQKEKFLKSIKELGTITKWQYCGVFENLNGSGLNIEYDPETYAKDDKKFNANSNGMIGWYSPKTEQEEGYHFFGNEKEYGVGVIYAQTFIEAKETKKYILSFGANKGLKIFLNDKEVYLNQDIQRTNLDAYNLKLSLNKGYNRLLFKLEVGSGEDYFSAQIRNVDFSIASDLVYSDKYQNYNPETSNIEVEEIPLKYEKYFDDLVKANPNNLLYKIYQFKVYESNCKKDKALETLDGLDKKYPKSSLIASYYIKYYDLLGDESQKIREILKNMEVNDEYYYYNTIVKFLDQEWMKKSSIQDLEKYKEISKKKYKQNFYEKMFDFIIDSRNGDIHGMLKKIEDISVSSYNNEKFQILVANLYLTLKNDKAKAIKILEELYTKKDNYQVSNTLLGYYNELGKKDLVNKIYLKRINDYPYINEFRTDYIDVLVKENKLDKALELIDENLSYFPYSFANMEKKADVFMMQKKYKEAEILMKQSLHYNSGNDALRKRMYDITKTPDEIEEIETKDIYNYIKNTRNTKVASDYGVVNLLDEYIVNVLPEGGRKEKVNYVCEITSEKGIEQMKEYSLNLSNNILKSEIVKSDGSIIPAEKGDNTLVFPNLKVGDVIYISYQYFQNSSGRFYKDFIISSIFDSSYPCLESSFSLIHPLDLKYSFKFSNGVVSSTVKELKSKVCTTWKRKDIPAISYNESFSPVFGDLTNKLSVGTIESWKEIANWYADLVKKKIKEDNEIKSVFKEIFPMGYKNISEEDRAKKIYSYIETNIKYSSQDFRQSGFVPQKPSKTISTKLGDCKDVSTLFLALSQMADLKSNLVLVLTNDNGYNSLLLPSTDFNHCIVKTVINKKEIFLELTDRFLPFKALPRSLFNAKALVVSFDKAENENAKLINIPFENSITNITKTKTVVHIDEKLKKYTNVHICEGAVKSYLNELFSADTTQEIRNKEIEDRFNKKLNKVISLNSVKLLDNSTFEKELTYKTEFSVAENLQKVGSLKITDIPFIDKVYTRDIIVSDKRNYEIDYATYEDNNIYDSEVIMKLPEGKSFAELPESKQFTFKKHNYSITFKLLDPKSLKITRKAIVSWDSISPSEYSDYKKFVENIIESEEQVVGFK